MKNGNLTRFFGVPVLIIPELLRATSTEALGTRLEVRQSDSSRFTKLFAIRKLIRRLNSLDLGKRLVCQWKDQLKISSYTKNKIVFVVGKT
jgi:hypothetical protein